jgi:copper chaperone CopZ
MPTLMSMEDLFYGPPEPTWILRDITPPPRIHEPLRPVERYVEPHRGISIDRSVRPVERVARRIHTVQGDPAVPVRAAHEEIRQVVEVPVRVPDHVPVATAPPVVVKRSVSPPIHRTIVHHPIELKVPMCCEKCAKKVKDRLLDLDGVESVVTDQYHQKVTVYGPTLDPARVLRRVKLVKKRSAFWDLTVDYSENDRRDQAENAAAAKSKSTSHAKLVAPLRSDLVVQLPQERDGPRVSAILQEERVPFVANSRIHSVRYVSPPKAYRQERFFNGRHEDRPGY